MNWRAFAKPHGGALARDSAANLQNTELAMRYELYDRSRIRRRGEFVGLALRSRSALHDEVFACPPIARRDAAGRRPAFDGDDICRHHSEPDG